MSVKVSYVDTCLPCYLVDHHTRPGELLVGVSLQGRHGLFNDADALEAVEELVYEAEALKPEIFEVISQEALIKAAKATALEVDFRPIDSATGKRVCHPSTGHRCCVGLDWEKACTGDDENPQVWFLIEWSVN